MSKIVTAKHTSAPATPPDLNALLSGALKNMMTIAQSAGTSTQEAITESTVALAHAATFLLEEGKKQSADIAKGAAREIKEHPITTAAAVTVAAVALMGLLAANQQRVAAASLTAKDVDAEPSNHEKKKKRKKH